MINLWLKIQYINSWLQKKEKNFRVWFSWKESKYYLLDAKYNFRIYIFKNKEEILKKDISEIEKIIDNYLRSSAYTKVKKNFCDEIGKYVLDKFWYSLEKVEDDKITFKNSIWNITLKLNNTNFKTITDLKTLIRILIRKVS